MKIVQTIFILLLASCSSPQATNAGIAGINTALCILNVYGQNVQAGKDATTIVADCVAQCGADVATVARVLDTHRGAEARERSAPAKFGDAGAGGG